VSAPLGCTLLLGGARSGKSTLAVEIGLRYPGAVCFVATARLDLPGGTTDHDLVARVARHRAERPAHWVTIETTAVDDAVRAAPADALVIVDCITLWVADALTAPDGTTGIEDAAVTLGTMAAARPAPTVLVSNEVGLGVHPATELGREYRDVLGRVNRTLAFHAHRTLFLAAGRAVRLEDPWELLG
jgi:adenosylcobinamide kinase / adenosylcobinamide-phosphate guanylyltransferase